MKLSMKTGCFLGLLLVASPVWAHGNHHHGHAEQPQIAENDPLKQSFERVNLAYLQRVRPIFAQKCFDCHSDQTVYPGYYKIPGVRQFIDSDIREGREHLDFSRDYPFISHAKPIEDLDAIRKEIDESEMPPLIYRLAHRDSAVTD